MARTVASSYPEDCGQYVYFREAGSRPLAFLCGWISFWATDPPSISIMALAIVNYLAFFIPIHGLALKLIAVAFVLVLLLTYNYKDGSQALTLKEIEAALSSDLISMCPPYRKNPNLFPIGNGFGFLMCAR